MADSPTPEQLEQAVAILANAVQWSRPPASDIVSPLQQMQQAQAALTIVVQAARGVAPSSNGHLREVEVATDGDNVSL
jgi:hypothetical protein